jgi:hypothetical protein
VSTADGLPLVWSEREPGPWDECTESAYLQGLVYGGHTAYQHGIYSDAERDALSLLVDPLDNVTGATFRLVEGAIRQRYGLSTEPLPPGLSLGAALRRPGWALILAGVHGRWREGHYLRRWQPTFRGAHAATAIPLDPSAVLFLDPLAPDGHPGDRVDPTTIELWADGPGPDDCRQVRRLQYLEATVLVRRILVNATATLPMRTPVYDAPTFPARAGDSGGVIRDIRATYVVEGDTYALTDAQADAGLDGRDWLELVNPTPRPGVEGRKRYVTLTSVQLTETPSPPAATLVPGLYRVPG